MEPKHLSNALPSVNDSDAHAAASAPRHLKKPGTDLNPNSTLGNMAPATPALGLPDSSGSHSAVQPPLEMQAAEPKRRRKWPIVLVIVIVVLLAGGFAIWKFGLLDGLFAGMESQTTLTESEGLSADDVDSAAEAAAAEAAAHDGFPTPVVAEYNGVLFHSPIHATNLNGLLFHQSSVPWGLPFSSQIPAADEAYVAETKDFGFAAPEDQVEGDEWLVGTALHLYRSRESTEMDTSLDVGAEAGDTVYAPVTGTVILVRTYKLYDQIEDYEIHMQPVGHPELDVVEIHITDVCVQAGDKVEGGVTPIAKVRDLAAEGIDGIQLAYYTAAGHGNHTHVQVNDTNYPVGDATYREARIDGIPPVQ